MHQFTRVRFQRFKAFSAFELKLRHFNVLVGPNNAGKSTILAAFRILSAGLRKAQQRKPELVKGPNGIVAGYSIDLRAISIAEENLFYNYDDTEPAWVTFEMSNGNELMLYFPEQSTCFLIPSDREHLITSPKSFKDHFDCPIGFVPILGPVEHNERLYEKEAARLALFNFRAARNFRNIWHHYPEHFGKFRALLQQTWPGMDVEPPRVQVSAEKPLLHMFCPEDRIPREIFWAGFGFQVWCQMLTHIVQSSEASIFLIDEPDIYLHADLQRQLVGLLRNLGPDILIATHSAEIITEAESDDIVVIDKRRKTSRRIKRPADLGGVFETLGSNLNPILTQLAKTRAAVFIEGKDYGIIGRIASKLGARQVASRSRFAVIPIDGFNPERVRNLKQGIETTLGSKITTALVLDKDYRSEEECNMIVEECSEFCDMVLIHKCKEIENHLLVPGALERAAERRIQDRANRTGNKATGIVDVRLWLSSFASGQRSYVMSQTLAKRRLFFKKQRPNFDDATVDQGAVERFEEAWKGMQEQLMLVPGKEALSYVNTQLQASSGVSITPSGIVDAMRVDEISSQMKELIQGLEAFATTHIPNVSVRHAAI